MIILGVKDFGKKLENCLLVLFLLLIPTQLGKHFWPDWSNVLGIRIDYLSPTLYLVDLVWLTWIVAKIFNLKFKNFSFKEKIFSFENLIFLLIIILNVLVANNWQIAIYRWIRIGQWWLTYKALRGGYGNPPIQRIPIQRMLRWIIPCWIIGESLLGLAQIINGQNLGGIFYWLGERRFEFNTIGIAQMSILGEGFLRAYGTFSHPNSLAGFMLVAWLMWTRQKLAYSGGQVKNIWYWVVWWMGLIGIIISGSRMVWLLAGIIIIKNYQLSIKNWKEILLVGLTISGIVWVVSWNYRVSDFVGGWDTNSLEKRLSLNLAALGMMRDNLMLGVGAGNFLVRLPEYQRGRQFYWLQPVHNIFLLALAEIGLLGIMMMGYKIIKNWKWQIKREWWVLAVIVVTGMVDHYWLTLPQNSWLLVMVLVIIGNVEKTNMEHSGPGRRKSGNGGTGTGDDGDSN